MRFVRRAVHRRSPSFLALALLVVAVGPACAATLRLGTLTPTQVAGDGDAAIEPGESWSLSVQLTNVGADTASSVTATLIPLQAGVEVTQGASAYPAMAASGSATNSTPFAFTARGIACGQAVLLRLLLRYTDPAGNERQRVDLALPTGTPTTTTNASYVGAPVAIPDGAPAGTRAFLSVSGAPTNLRSVTFSIDGTACTTTAGATTVGIDHTASGDVDLALRSPSGTQVLLIDQVGGTGHNFCQVLLDDASAGASIQTVGGGQAPYTGTWKPAGLLSRFAGENPNGIWEVIAIDQGAGDTGSLRAFSLHLTGAQCNTPAGAILYAGQSVTSHDQPGDPLQLRVVLRNRGPGTQTDNAGDEFTETLPAQLQLNSVSATSGTASMTGNTIHWNGALLAGDTATLFAQATVQAATAGQTVTLQGTASYDSDGNGSNESTSPSDNADTRAGFDANVFPILTGGPLTVTASYNDRTLHVLDFGVDPPTVSGPFFDHDELGDRGELLGVATAPDGSYALITNFSQRRLFKVDLTNPARPTVAGFVDLPTTLGGAEDLAIAPNGTFAVMSGGGGNNHLAFVALPDLRVLGDYALTTASGTAECVTVAPDNQTVIVCDNPNARLIVGTVNAGHTGLVAESTTAVPSAPFNVAVAPDGQTVLVGTFDTAVPIFRLTAPGVLAAGSPASVAGLPGGQQSFSFSPAGDRAYAASVSSSPDALSVLNITAPGTVSLGTASAASLLADSNGFALYGVDTLATAAAGARVLGTNSGGRNGGTIAANVSVVATSGFAVASAATQSDFPVGVASFALPSAACTAGQGGTCFHALAPCRIFDSRLGGGPPLPSGTNARVAITGEKCAIPATATAVSFNVTAVSATGTGTLILFPDRGAVPGTSSLSFTTKTRANNVVMALERNGDGGVQVRPVIAPGGSVHVVIDVNGYFSD